MKDKKDKTVATLLCFFLGGLGIHKFYLGQSGLGIIYLIFFWTLIPGIIAFFEFIILILMSEADFNRQYNSNLVSTTSTGSIKDATESLSELKKLYDQGIITAEEYEEKRKKVLNNI
jgi:TM2 domain-containing membrane protein YozV